MYRPSTTQRKGMEKYHKHVNDVAHNNMVVRQTSESARKIFNTPPYYLTAKKKEENPQKEDCVIGFDISELAKEMNQEISEEQRKWFEQNYYKFDRTNPMSAEQIRIILEKENRGNEHND